MARVAHFTFNLHSYSGAALQALALARRISGHESIFFNAESSEATRRPAHGPGGLSVIDLPSRPPMALARALTELRRRRCDLLHLHGAVPSGLLAATLLGKPFILKTTLVGDDDFDSLPARRFGWLLYQLARRANFNIALSEPMASINARHLARGRIICLPNGVELGEPPLRRAAPLFCTVGAVTPRKRTHVAINRFIATFAHLPGAKLYVVGPNENDFNLGEIERGYLRHCKEQIPPQSESQVEFTGHLCQEQLLSLYRECMGFMLFSENEGMPNALLEAMAANCVPIVSPLGGVAREIITADGACGFVLDDSDPTPSFEQLLVVTATERPRHRVAAAFSLENLAGRYAELYDRLVPSYVSP